MDRQRWRGRRAQSTHPPTLAGWANWTLEPTTQRSEIFPLISLSILRDKALAHSHSRPITRVCLSMVGLWRCHKYLQYICIYILKTHRNVDICLEIGDFVVWKSVVLLHLDIQGWWLRGGAVKWKLFILILSWEPKVRNCITGPLRMFISHHPPHDNLGFDRNALVMSRHFARDMIRYNSFHFREIIRNY